MSKQEVYRSYYSDEARKMALVSYELLHEGKRSKASKAMMIAQKMEERFRAAHRVHVGMCPIPAIPLKQD